MAFDSFEFGGNGSSRSCENCHFWSRSSAHWHADGRHEGGAKPCLRDQTGATYMKPDQVCEGHEHMTEEDALAPVLPNMEMVYQKHYVGVGRCECGGTFWEEEFVRNPEPPSCDMCGAIKTRNRKTRALDYPSVSTETGDEFTAFTVLMALVIIATFAFILIPL